MTKMKHLLLVVCLFAISYSTLIAPAFRAPAASEDISCRRLLRQILIYDDLQSSIRQEQLLAQLRREEESTWASTYSPSSRRNITYKALLGLDTPVSLDKRVALNQRWKRIDEIYNAGHITVRNRAIDQVNSLRMSGSNTISDSTEALQATQNWLQANATVEQWAELEEPLSLAKIKRINEILGADLTFNDAVPGTFRQAKDEIYADMDWERQYVLGVHVEQAMNDFMRWYQQAEKNMHPVELAARSYQRLVTIHPFNDANGRTTRLVMDWILQSKGYPPATLVDNELAVAIFGRKTDNVTADELLEWVTDGIERTLNTWGVRQ